MGTYRVIGGEGSPYSVKVRGVFRYRRIPHVWVRLDDAASREIAGVRPPVIPVVMYPDGSYRNDSTPLIFDLEERHEGRGVVPTDAATAFLACVIEDMADEWGTKPMFHYRWDAERDQRLVSYWLTYDRAPFSGEEELERRAGEFRERQTGRVEMVGGGEANRGVVEESARRLWEVWEGQVKSEGPFLFGGRPSLADFGWYGQLRQLASDPTPSDKMKEACPYTHRWTGLMDDLSGLEVGEWNDGGLSSGAKGLLELAGELYLPFLEANAAAVEGGLERVEMEVWGMGYKQAPFRYQVKCLRILKERYAALSGEGKKRVDAALEETGCLRFFALLGVWG